MLTSFLVISYQKSITIVTVKQEEFPIEVKVGSVCLKIYRNVEPTRTRYTIAYNDGAIRKTKHFTDLDKAKKFTRETATRLQAGLGGELTLTGKVRDDYMLAAHKLQQFNIPLTTAIDEYVECKKVNVPMLAACQFYKDKHQVTLPQKFPAEVVEEFLTVKKQDGMSYYYLHDCKCRLGKFAQDMKCNIADIDANAVDVWLRGLQVTGRTRNNYRAMLKTLFRFARSRGYLAKNEPTATDELAKAKYVAKPVGIYTPDEFSKLLNLPDSLTNTPKKNIIPFFVLGGLCGLRHQETTRITWEDVDLTQRVVRVAAEKAKTGSYRLAPICDTAAEWLKLYVGKGTICTENQTRCARYLAINNGIKWKKNGLRHSYGTYRLAILKDVAALSLEMGNSPKVIFEHYRLPVTEKDGKAFFNIFPSQPANGVASQKKIIHKREANL